MHPRHMTTKLDRETLLEQLQTFVPSTCSTHKHRIRLRDALTQGMTLCVELRNTHCARSLPWQRPTCYYCWYLHDTVGIYSNLACEQWKPSALSITESYSRARLLFIVLTFDAKRTNGYGLFSCKIHVKVIKRINNRANVFMTNKLFF